MKNQNNKAVLATETELPLNKQETVFPMETVGFTNIIEDELKETSPLEWSDLLDFIAFEHNLNCMFTPFGLFGRGQDIKKAQKILINSVKYN